jgi:Ca2+-binding EF-hand superfamily protein
MKTVLTALSVAFTFALAAFAEDAPKPAQAPMPDLAKGAIDPFESGAQRAKFMRAAGVDSELSQAEFDDDARKDDGFARKFDKWESLARFDANKNGTIDWLEATGYREDLRKRFLAAYDADKNGKLNGEERVKANEALAAGKMPPALGVARAASATPGARGPGGAFGGPGGEQFQEIQKQLLAKYDKDGDGQLNREERRASADEARQLYQQAFIKQFDTNGDGKLDDAEQQAARDQFRARMEEGFKRRFDKDGDGVLNAAEQAEYDKARADYQKQAEEGRARFMKEFDKNGDGQLDDAERQAMTETFRQRGEQRRADFLKRFDADGDGQISDAERQTGTDTMRKEFMDKYDTDHDGQISAEEGRKAAEDGAFNGFGGFGRGGFGGPGGFGGFPGGRGGAPRPPRNAS